MHVPLTEVVLRHEGVELARTTLPPGEYVIGRGADAEIRADTPLISRRHARLTIHYDHLLLEDLRSSNGTFVNEQPVAEPTRLFPNQSVRLGPDITLEVRRQRPPTEPGVSLAPAQAAIRRHLPDEFLAEKRYAIGGVIARGGMGAILDARQSAMKRGVAMKVMLDTGEEADVLRFIEEAQITGQLEHPNIVPVHELGVDEQDQLFYTMKFVRGITLKKVLELLVQGVPETVKKYPFPVLLTIFQKVCDAVAFAHSKGVIHRDLKPENLMLGDFGSVLVMDWGLAKVFGKNGASGEDVTRSAVLSARAAEPAYGSTMAGSIMGTPSYMSPEQARGEVEILGAPSDIYALGAILFEILHLRPPYSGAEAMQIVRKVAKGAVEWDAKKSAAIPGSLLAITRKALAFETAARYRNVEALQADLLAYQNGFATSAERAGAWKQMSLFLRRNKTATIGAAAVLLVGTVFGAGAIVQGRKAAVALASLKKTAPALRRLAETEAGAGRFDSALANLDAAIALDPAERSAYWRRPWMLLGKEDYAEAAAAIRRAQSLDPAHAAQGAILSVVEQLAAADESARWTPERAQAIDSLLQRVGAAGERSALSDRMKFGTEEKKKLIRDRLDQWLGKDKGRVNVTDQGLIELHDLGATVNSLEQLHGLPINGLNVDSTAVTDLEPLRGMPLTWISITQTKIVSLEPLRGMRLTKVVANGCDKITDWSPLQGMPIREISINGQFYNVSFLSEAPLEFIDASGTGLTDISSLRGKPLKEAIFLMDPISSLDALSNAPLENLEVGGHFTDLSPLRGKPLRHLHINGSKVSDLSPLKGAPITELDVSHCPITDFRPLLDLPKLAKLRLSGDQRGLEVLRNHPTLRYVSVESDPLQPLVEFWPKYDALVAAEKGASKQKLEALLAGRAKTLPDGTIELDISGQNISDLSVLKGVNLSRLKADNNPISDLSPLRGTRLRDLNLCSTHVTDLAPIEGMPLRSLYVSFSPVSNLSPVRGTPLEKLFCDFSSIKDLSPLADLPKLRNVIIPRAAANIEVLRPLRNLETLGWEDDWDGAVDDTGRSKLTAEQFWKRYDDLKAAAKK